MKKKFALVLAAAMLALSACGGPAADTGESSSDVDVSTSAPGSGSAAAPEDGSQPEEAGAAGSSQPKPDGSGQKPGGDGADVTEPEPPAVKPEPSEGDTSGGGEGTAPRQPEEKPAPSETAPSREKAAAYIGKSVSSMIAAIGEPNSRSYAPSCLGEGEDGELIYDGFTVYTYREDGSETVEDVL